MLEISGQLAVTHPIRWRITKWTVHPRKWGDQGGKQAPHLLRFSLQLPGWFANNLPPPQFTCVKTPSPFQSVRSEDVGLAKEATQGQKLETNMASG